MEKTLEERIQRNLATMRSRTQGIQQAFVLSTVPHMRLGDVLLLSDVELSFSYQPDTGALDYFRENTAMLPFATPSVVGTINCAKPYGSNIILSGPRYHSTTTSEAKLVLDTSFNRYNGLSLREKETVDPAQEEVTVLRRILRLIRGV